MNLNRLYHEHRTPDGTTVYYMDRAALESLPGHKRVGDHFRAQCPIHGGDSYSSFQIDYGTGWGHCFKCEAEGISWKLRVADHPETTLPRRHPDHGGGDQVEHESCDPIPSAYHPEGDSVVYQYQDEYGTDLYQNVRNPQKQFRQRRVMEDGTTQWGLGGHRQVPYGLPELVDSRYQHLAVHLCEGEKDTIRLRSEGLLAISVASGAMRDEIRTLLAGRHIVIHEDNDKAGRNKAAKLVDWLRSEPASIRVMRYTDLPEKGDVSDWWDSGGTIAEFRKQVAAIEPEPRVSVDSDWKVPEPLQPSHGPTLDPSVLPARFREFCEALAGAMQVPLDMVVTNGLGVVSAAVTGGYSVEYRWIEPAHGMFLSVANPGERKSPLIHALSGRLYKLQMDRQEHDRLQIAEWESVNRSLVKQRENLEREPRKGEVTGADRDLQRRAAVQEEHEHQANRPTITTIIIDDATPQAVAWMMTQQRGVAVVSAESAYLENFYRYNGDAPDFNAFLSGHAGESISIHRRSGESATTDRACLSLSMSIQPDSLKRMGGVQGFMERGGTARLMMAIPKSMAGSRLTGRDVPTMPESLLEWWEEALVRLFESVESNTGPSHIQLSAEAFAAIENFEAVVEDRYRFLGDDVAMRAWMSKQAGAALRLAGLLHLISGDPAKPIDLATAESAIALSEWYRAHATVAFSMMAESDDDLARSVWDALVKFNVPAVERRELHMKLRGRTAFKSASDLDAPLSTLETLGYIRLRKVDPKHEGRDKGGRPASWIDLNPLALPATQSLNSQNSGNHHTRANDSLGTDAEAENPNLVEVI